MVLKVLELGACKYKLRERCERDGRSADGP